MQPGATVLGSSVGTVESEGRQMKQCWIYVLRKKMIKNPNQKIFMIYDVLPMSDPVPVLDSGLLTMASHTPFIKEPKNFKKT